MSRGVPSRIALDRVRRSTTRLSGISLDEPLALIASYSTRTLVTRSLSALIAELERLGYATVVIRADDQLRDLQWPSDVRPRAIVTKHNVGYDFGSWAIGMHDFAQHLANDRVLLVNDSMTGPFDSLEHVIASFESSPSDAWAVTRSLQGIPHLQSWFLGFRGGVLTDGALRSFWGNLPLLHEKDQIIARYEMGLARLLFSEAYSMKAMVEAPSVVRGMENPSIIGWKGLLDAGVPLVKRELVRLPSLAPDGHLVDSEILRRYNATASEWLT